MSFVPSREEQIRAEERRETDRLLDAAQKAIADTAKQARLDAYADAARVVESWKGRRLAGECDDKCIGDAFGRGVDMAAHYIAAAIRGRAKEVAGE